MDIAKLHAEGRKFRTKRAKHAVRILCTDRKGSESVVFMEEWDNEDFLVSCSNTGDGLIEPIPIEREGWVIMSKGMNLHSLVYTEEDTARDVARTMMHVRVARITWQE